MIGVQCLYVSTCTSVVSTNMQKTPIFDFRFSTNKYFEVNRPVSWHVAKNIVDSYAYHCLPHTTLTKMLKVIIATTSVYEMSQKPLKVLIAVNTHTEPNCFDGNLKLKLD